MEGVASDLYLPKGKILYHGSPAEEFTHRHEPTPLHFKHPPTPDYPAWFADNVAFSLHAAMRFTDPAKQGQIVLHQYQVRVPLHLMSLETIGDFRIFMDEQMGIPDLQINGLLEAIPLALWSNEPRGLDGYALMHDTVRGEPEYVLFHAGLERLRYEGPRIIQVNPVDGTRSDLIDKATGTHIATYTYDDGPGDLVMVANA